MIEEKEIVLWDNGIDKLCLHSIKKGEHIDYDHSVSFGVSYENFHFKGHDFFTLVDKEYFDCIKKIEKTFNTLNGTFHVSDSMADTDGHIEFTIENGHVFVDGVLGSTFNSHSLKFEFEADQTMIGILLNSIMP